MSFVESDVGGVEPSLGPGIEAHAGRVGLGLPRGFDVGVHAQLDAAGLTLCLGERLIRRLGEGSQTLIPQASAWRIMSAERHLRRCGPRRCRLIPPNRTGGRLIRVTAGQIAIARVTGGGG